MAVTKSILLYGSQMWADTLKQKKYNTRMVAIQRIDSSRIMSSPESITGQAVLMIAGVIPIDLLAEERQWLYEKPVIGIS